MFQTIDPYVFDNHFEPYEPSPEDQAVFLKDRRVFVLRDEDGLYLPKCGKYEADYSYLFSVSGVRFFLGRELPDALKEADSFLGYRDLFGQRPEWLAFAAMIGLQIGCWYEDSTFCGRCGERMKHSPKERAMICPHCGRTVYPRINPVIITAVRDGERLLLTKYARGFDRYALVAGFAEVGETIEETVKREVFEEVGVHVKNIAFFGSQPWPHSESLLLGFVCDADGDTAITLQRSELSEGIWMLREQVPVQENTLSLTSTLIEAFRTGKI